MSKEESPPPGFQLLSLPSSGWIESVGPFFARVDKDRLFIGLRVADRHCNSSGGAHGGMLLSLVDVVLTVTSNLNADLSRFLPTINVTCDFMSRVEKGEWIEGSADVLSVTRAHVFSSLVLHADRQRPCLRASGVLALRGDASAQYSRNAYLSNLKGPTP